MKKILHIAFLLIGTISSAQDMSYAQWQQEGLTNIRLHPKFNNAEKNAEQKAADDQLIYEYVKQEGSREKASETLVKLGFNYLYQDNIKIAMYRFNQAWLLNPENENAFWGFGAIYLSFGDVDKALAQYDEGLKLNPESTNILTDKATAYMYKFQQELNAADMDTAITLLLESYAIDRANQNTVFKLSACYFFREDCANALRYFKECEALGGQPITDEYREAITKRCNS